MKSFRRKTIDTKTFISDIWPEHKDDLTHISYDKNMKFKDCDARYVRRCGHDGTLLFSQEMLEKLLINILNSKIHYKNNDLYKTHKVEYVLSDISNAAVFTKIKTGAGMIDGMRESASVMIKINYVKED